MGTAIVTGASSGIGKVYADRLAQRGYNLRLVARRADRLEAVAKDLQARYGVAVQTDVADLSNAAELEKVAGKIGSDTSVTLLVNNAGTNKAGTVSESKWEDLEAMIRINVIALTRLTAAVLPGFQNRDRGAIINLASVVGFYRYPGVGVYSATKAFVNTFTRALQDELAGSNIVVQLVAPAATVSEIWEIGGMPLSSLPPGIVMTTEDCVDAALRGLDMGEKTTLPSMNNPQLLSDYEAASSALFGATSNGKPAERYLATQ